MKKIDIKDNIEHSAMKQWIEKNDRDIEKLYDHAKVANEEMGKIREDVSGIKTDITWLRDGLNKVDIRSWWILGTVIFGIIIQISFNLIK